jgi:hypothetical protein
VITSAVITRYSAAPATQQTTAAQAAGRPGRTPATCADVAAMAVAWVPTTHSCQVPFTSPMARRRPAHEARKARTAPLSAIQASAVTAARTATTSSGPWPASRAPSTLAAAGKAK